MRIEGDRMKRLPRFILALGIGMLVCGPAIAAEPAPADPTPEQRQKMAEVHQQMAACLVSARPIAECRAEMHKNCQTMMGNEGCPMMHGGGMGPGMMGGGGMMQPPVKPATPSAPNP
jgi:hypothetical protein